MEEKLDRIEKNIGNLTGAVVAIEKNLTHLTGKVGIIEKNVNDLTEIVVAIKDHMVTNMVTKDELKSELTNGLAGLREELVYKIEGVQRAVDAGFERHSAIEARVTKCSSAQHEVRGATAKLASRC